MKPIALQEANTELF